MKRNYIAFTLAEVLITLGIIGIVAALTIPALITKYQDKVTITALKKSYSTLKSAMERAEDDLGSVKDWDIYNHGSTESTKMLANILMKYFNGSQLIDRKLSCSDGIKSLAGNCPAGIHSYYGQSFIIPDGTIFYCFSNWIFVDINGYKGPNIQGKDIFELRVGESNQPSIIFNGEKDSLNTIFTTTGEGACRNTEPDVNGHNGNKCAAAILKSGWQIPSNYPR